MLKIFNLDNNEKMKCLLLRMAGEWQWLNMNMMGLQLVFDKYTMHRNRWNYLIHQIGLKIHVITTEFCFFFEKTTGNISVWSYLIQVFFLLLSINSKRVFYEIILQVCLCCLFVKLGMSIFDLAREVISTVSQIFVFLGTPPFYKYKF